MSENKRVLVAMSGGVDSSVTALLLKQQGYEVIGAHMKLWDYVEVGGDIYKDGRCCSLDSINDCRSVCDLIEVPFYVLNLSEQFRKQVIEDFVQQYRIGRTPNPCIRCNTEVKWSAFLDKAEELGCDYIATGHYSFIEKTESGRWSVRRGVDGTRDQSYVLWGLDQQALSKTLMPLGGILKSEVRQVARDHGLKTAERKESREICFVADDNYKRFLREWEEKRGVTSRPGRIVHADGTELGVHNGIEFFTVGQRRGMGIAYPTPLYVQEIDHSNNRVIVGDDETLYKDELIAESVNWMGIVPENSPFAAEAKIRYLHPPAQALITPLTGASVKVTFDRKQRAITPGQSVVFYNGDIVLGGGLIVKAY